MPTGSNPNINRAKALLNKIENIIGDERRTPIQPPATPNTDPSSSDLNSHSDTLSAQRDLTGAAQQHAQNVEHLTKHLYFDSNLNSITEKVAKISQSMVGDQFRTNPEPILNLVNSLRDNNIPHMAALIKEMQPLDPADEVNIDSLKSFRGAIATLRENADKQSSSDKQQLLSLVDELQAITEAATQLECDAIRRRLGGVISNLDSNTALDQSLLSDICRRTTILASRTSESKDLSVEEKDALKSLQDVLRKLIERSMSFSDACESLGGGGARLNKDITKNADSILSTIQSCNSHAAQHDNIEELKDLIREFRKSISAAPGSKVALAKHDFEKIDHASEDIRSRIESLYRWMENNPNTPGTPAGITRIDPRHLASLKLEMSDLNTDTARFIFGSEEKFRFMCGQSSIVTYPTDHDGKTAAKLRDLNLSMHNLVAASNIQYPDTLSHDGNITKLGTKAVLKKLPDEHPEQFQISLLLAELSCRGWMDFDKLSESASKLSFSYSGIFQKERDVSVSLTSRTPYEAAAVGSLFGLPVLAAAATAISASPLVGSLILVPAEVIGEVISSTAQKAASACFSRQIIKRAKGAAFKPERMLAEALGGAKLIQALSKQIPNIDQFVINNSDTADENSTLRNIMPSIITAMRRVVENWDRIGTANPTDQRSLRTEYESNLDLAVSDSKPAIAQWAIEAKASVRGLRSQSGLGIGGTALSLLGVFFA